MATKRDANKSVNVLDVFWDSWFNSYKTFYSFQDAAESKSIQMFEGQKDWIQSASDQLSRLEEDSKKVTSEWKSSFQDALNKAQNEYASQTFSEWSDKVEELGNKAQTLAFSPGKASLEMLSKSHAHLENTFKNAIDQQQQNRAEVIKAIESFVEQLKQTQTGLLKSFDSYNPIAK
ncbi:gas vesicle protein [Oikeobacillus pervagus]|uniref:Gas vesicle protein n=1 Tax=Oikeobacillus pervagus TaxID=1325931 RepID=A0AAJ1T109_9BACI|nr:hypothetical protein [Oikeobacillus pervagus]MDQ0213984.1 gas vesicle protein [Oikeobacillus pervagus]